MKAVEFSRTCFACPSQWEGELDDGRRLYVRYRHSWLNVGVGETADDAVDVAFRPEALVRSQVGGLGDVGDGYMTGDELREHLARLLPDLDLSGVDVA